MNTEDLIFHADVVVIDNKRKRITLINNKEGVIIVNYDEIINTGENKK